VAWDALDHYLTSYHCDCKLAIDQEEDTHCLH